MNIYDQFALTGRTALVTGAARGIGKAIALGFAAAGAHVWIADILTDGQTVADAIGGRFVHIDLSDPGAITDLCDRVKAAGALDILVNNAGIERHMALERLDLAGMEQVWAINARAPALLCHGLLPLLRASTHASIINVISIHADTPHPGNFPYNMSKAALAMFTRSMAQELSPLGIRVNNLAPGAVETEINRQILADMGHDHFNEWIPLGRVAQTDEMVGPALFLASDASRYVTGATLVADGGYSHNLVRYRLDV